MVLMTRRMVRLTPMTMSMKSSCQVFTKWLRRKSMKEGRKVVRMSPDMQNEPSKPSAARVKFIGSEVFVFYTVVKPFPVGIKLYLYELVNLIDT